MEHIAYIRVSTTDQNTDRQDFDGVDVSTYFTDKASGGSTKRPQLEEMKRHARKGDVIHVHSMDRLARDLSDLQGLVKFFNDKGVTVQFHKEGLTFSGQNDSMQTLMLQVMGAFAQFERSLIKERQAEGIAKAKAKGVYTGRSKSIDREKIHSLKSEGISPSQIARDLGIARSSVYRVLEE